VKVPRRDPRTRDRGLPLGHVRRSDDGYAVSQRSWYSYEGAKIGQGRDKVLAHLDEHPSLQQQLRAALIAQARRAASGQAGANGTSHE
jgi:hypothetical protein